MTSTCLNCGRDEREVPLLSLHYRDRTLHICPQCLPLLIHSPERLIGKFPGAEALHPADPDE
ncbi:MAG: hypothetical protein D6770_07540 [Anaerolineae bacterium]|nr:MAG: hypothetical protein D6770_07540 [Anaerolineae bacterium]